MKSSLANARAPLRTRQQSFPPCYGASCRASHASAGADETAAIQGCFEMRVLKDCLCGRDLFLRAHAKTSIQVLL